MARTALLLSAALVASCRSAPRTEFELSAVPAEARFRTSWGATGSVPATLAPPVEPGRQWLLVVAPGFHSQEVRFAYRDRSRPDPADGYAQPLHRLDTSFDSPPPQSDLDRDLTLDFERVHVELIPLDRDPPFVVDLDGGYSISRVRVD